MEELDMKYRVEAEQLGNYIGKTVKMHGMVYKIRKMSDFAFVLIRTVLDS